MTNATIEIRGLDALQRKLGAGAGPIIRVVVRGVAEEIRNAIAEYPGPVSYPIQWSSPAQRAAYHAKRQGLGPYVRQTDPFSQRLGPSWATQMDGDERAVVGTRVSYARWVQSAEQQQPMHAATGWTTDEEAVEKVEESRAAERLLESAISKW